MTIMRFKEAEELKILSKNRQQKFNWYWAPPFMAFWFLLFFIVVIRSFYHFPNTLEIQDEIKHAGSFIGERAETTLLKLTKIGPKVVGSTANEVTAVNVLLNEIKDVEKDMRKDIFDLEYEVQNASGNYVIWEMVNVYQGIQNVVVKLTPKHTNSTATLLLNSHYDSVPGSSGAGDSGMMCVIMLEVLRVISKYDTKIMHSIVFLFNGAEENPLQGSHAFITQHRWAKNVKGLINLDSAGSGGREILFQSGPDHPWLMKYYGAHIKHPYASTIGEELFQNGFVPSETDFRVFRDFGHIPGLDMAHSFNGYVYHTKYDRLNLIPHGSYQLTGDNVLALTKALANAPEMEDPAKHAEGHTVFYDVLGWFIVYYSETTGMIINIVVCVVAVATIFGFIWNLGRVSGISQRQIFIKFGILAGIQIGTVILAMLITITVAVFIDGVNLAMPWYSQIWMVLGLYFCPMFFIMGIFPALYFNRTKEQEIPLGYSLQLLMHAHCLILTIITIIMISFTIRSAFVIMLCIGFYTLSVIINMIMCYYKHPFLWTIPHMICQILPFLFYTYICYAFYITFVPMEGRDSANSNPELMIGGFTAIMCLLFAGFLIPLLCLFHKSRIIISIFGGICLLFIILAATPAAFPYTEKQAPQRFYAVHTTRTFHNDDAELSVRRQDAGFYVVPVDRRPHTIDFMFENGDLTKAGKEDCEKEVLCGYPIYSSRWMGWRKESFWIPAPAPERNGWPILKVNEKQRLSTTRVRYIVEVSGPDHMSMFIQPLDGAKLVDWTFEREPLDNNFKQPYFVYFSYATDPTPLTFELEFERSSGDWSGSTFDIAVSGHKVHENTLQSEVFRKFLASFPAWSYVSAWTSSYESWRL